jgi:hypothetical protein
MKKYSVQMAADGIKYFEHLAIEWMCALYNDSFYQGNYQTVYMDECDNFYSTFL